MDLQIIQQKIFEIRGHKVMLDFDLAILYEVETKRLNEAVKRNITRFPDDFMFQLTTEEWNMMWSQFATTSKSSRRRKDSLPYAFTENHDEQLVQIYDILDKLLSAKAAEDNWENRDRIGFKN